MRRSLPLFVSLLAACATPERALPTFSSTDSAGIRIARSTAEAWAAGEGWSVGGTPSVEIGLLDGDDAYLLHQVVAGTRQSDGSILIVDGGTREIRRYDASGTHLATLGGRGQGPGEFRYPSQVMVGRGDTVVAWDNLAHRITRFGPSGGLIDVVSVDRGRIAASIDPPFFSEMTELLPDGRLLVHLFEGGRTEAYPRGLFRPRGGALVTDVQGSRIDTLRFFGGREQMFVETSQGQMPMVPPHAKRSVMTFQGSPTRVCIGDQVGPEVTCFAADGQETRIRWPSDPVPVTEAEREAWADRITEFYEGRMDGAVARQAVSAVVVPEYRPAYGTIHLDRFGYLWAAVPGFWGDDDTVFAYRVFDPDGRLLGTVDLPARRILEIGEDYVIAVRTDEADVEYVGVYDLIR